MSTETAPHRTLEQLIEERGHVLANASEISGGHEPVELGIDLDGDEPPAMPWRTGTRWRDGGETGRKAVTLERCNAIREAAHDGLGYTEIAELLSCVSSRSAAWDHGTGQCVHGDGDVPPLETDPKGGAGYRSRVTTDECKLARERHEAGDTCAAIGGDLGFDESAIYRHVAGRCSHS